MSRVCLPYRSDNPLRTGWKKFAGRYLTPKQAVANQEAEMKEGCHCEAMAGLLCAGLLSWCSKRIRAAVMALAQGNGETDLASQSRVG